MTISFCIAQDYQSEVEAYRLAAQKKLYTGERVPLAEADIQHLQYFKANESFEVIAEVILTPEAKPFEMPTYSGITKIFIKYADLHFNLNGEKLKLSVYKNLMLANKPIYKNHLFLPFMDLTNGEETYGGGRYIDMLVSDITDNKVGINFNKAYNPWCAYSDGFNCPIPPVENRLEIALNAGEKMYTGPKKKRSK